MTRSGWIVFVLVLTAALSLWLATTWTRDAEESTSPAEPELEASAAPEPAAPGEPEPEPEPAPEPVPAEPAPSAPVAPAQPAPPAVPEPTAEPRVNPDLANLPPPEKSGPVDEFKAQFAREPRDSAAREVEKHIESVFKSGGAVPPELLGSVLCHRTVCRIQTRWTPARATGFMAVFMGLLMDPSGTPSPVLEQTIAISPEAVDPNGEHTVDVYLKRRAPPE